MEYGNKYFVKFCSEIMVLVHKQWIKAIAFLG